MIPHGVEVFVALDPVDLRWSFDRLTGLCQGRLGRDARSGALSHHTHCTGPRVSSARPGSAEGR